MVSARCCRTPEQSTALLALASKHANLQTIALDISDFAQIDAVTNQLKDLPIDVLINNAGIYPPSCVNDAMDYDAWTEGFRINTIAPYKVITSFLSHVKRSQLKKVATLSSKVGSIDDSKSGGSYFYRSSKTAVNMVMKSLTIDLSAQESPL